MSAPSPIDIQDPTLMLKLLIDDNPLQDYFPVESMEIVHEINRISDAEIVIIYKTDNGEGFNQKKNNPFTPGSTLEVQAGYGYKNDNPGVIFKGIIVRQRIQLTQYNAYKQTVTCKHPAVEMTNDTQAKEFYNQTDSAIIGSLVQSCTNKLSCTMAATSVEMPFLPKQEGSSDWDFILARAEFNGCVVTLGVDSVRVSRPDPGGDPVLGVILGQSLITFQAETFTENQPSTVEATAWDIKTQQQLTAEAAEPSLSGPLQNAITQSGPLQTEKFVLKSNTSLTQEELQSWADGKLLRMRLSALRGEISFMGNAGIKPGDNIQVQGIGDDYDGNIFVSSVKHSITGGNWTSTLKLGLEDKSVTEKAKFAPPPAGGQIPPIQGVQVATVKQIYDDPESQYRILVNLPSKAQTQDGVWARVANLYGTNGAGSVFLPEVGDEVVVGFYESDPRFPVVLGAMYSTNQASPQPAADNNNYIKTLVTKSKLKLVFDDQNTVLTITTPAGNVVTLSDKDQSVNITDQSGNSIALTTGGITLDSKGDINLKATGNITLNATGKLSGTASQDIAFSGMNINHSANVGFSAKGNTTAELSASVQTTVKGGIVMIN